MVKENCLISLIYKHPYFFGKNENVLVKKGNITYSCLNKIEFSDFKSTKPITNV